VLFSGCGVTWTRDNDEPAAPAPKRRRPRETAPSATRERAATDLLLRGSFTEGYELVEAASGRAVASGLGSLEEVLAVAQQYGGAIWQQQADRFGRPMGKPIRLTLQAE
jgi:hypothetical protein